MAGPQPSSQGIPPGYQPPQGYGPPGYPPQGYAQPYYPPPGMYPPPKSGFPVWAILLIVGAVVIVPIGILALAAIPLIARNSRDMREARASEAESMLGSAKDRCRVYYIRDPSLAPSSLSRDVGMGRMEQTGSYWVLQDQIGGSWPDRILLTATPVGHSDPPIQIEFDAQTGESRFIGSPSGP